MSGIEKIGLTLSFSSLIFILLLIALAGYAVYSYLHTIPEVSRLKRFILISLRTLALLLLLFIAFEPVLSLTKRESFTPVNLVYIDNSRSIRIDDGTGREEDVNSIVSSIKNSSISSFSQIYSFGNKVNLLKDSVNLPFSEGNTDIASVFNSVEASKENISSVTIISDGVITAGSNPVYKAADLNIPVFAVGIGDSSGRNDISIKDVTSNEYIYAGVSTIISAGILNKGFIGSNVSVSLSEEGKEISRQNIILDDNGYQETSFEYKAAGPGEKKLSVSVTELKGEQTNANNRKVFFVNVLSSKIKIVILAGAPSPDISFIHNSLRQDQNFTVSTITQIAPGKYLEKNNRDNLIDSADIFILAGFPSRQTDNNLLNKVARAITAGRKPFTVILSEGIDLNRLNVLSAELPFTINRSADGYTEVLPDLNESKTRNPLLQPGTGRNISDWNALPPVYMTNSDITAKPESEVLVKIKSRNIPINKPLILSRKVGSRKSVAVLAKDIWRWKLQTAVKDLQIFDNFLHNTVKWLNTPEDQKQVVIRTSKKVYSLGEEIEFTGQVYDPSFNPVADARLVVNIISEGEKNELLLDPVGNGIYQGIFITNRTGDYSFTGDAFVDDSKIGSDKGTFNIGEVDVEMMNPVMDYAFLSLISSETKGRFFLPEQSDDLINAIKQRAERTSDVKIITSEFSLWSNEWLMAIVIFLFAAEWFIRKQSGML